jgi:hypothetical protein
VGNLEPICERIVSGLQHHRWLGNDKPQSAFFLITDRSLHCSAIRQ